MVGRGVRAVPERVRVGGAQQWILERGEDRRNPVLLYVHGGPGTSQLTRNRRCTRSLEKYFTVVDWDQRGAGKSYAAIRDESSMCIDRFVEDTREVAELLLDRHHQQRLALLGHSWGSAVGALAAARHPHLFSCYVGTGQVARMADGEAASYSWVLAEAQRQGRRRAVAQLERIGPPPYRGDWLRATITERRYVARFGGEVYGSRIGAMGPVLRGLLRSRDYSLADRLNYFRGIFGSMRLLWPELLTVDLFVQVPRLDIPVFLLEGRHDHEVPAMFAEQWFDELVAPSKELIWFDRSAHMAQSEEPDKFNQVVIDKVLPLAAATA